MLARQELVLAFELVRNGQGNAQRIPGFSVDAFDGEGVKLFHRGGPKCI
jgi:hypothetical protein